MRKFAVPLALALAVSGALTSSCTTRHKLTSVAYAEPESSERAKLHMQDGGVFVLEEWRIEGDAFVGFGASYDVERVLIARGTFRVPKRAVALIETNEHEIDGPMLAMGLVSAASLSFTVVCAANPKACFGSCPTFYVPAGGEWKLQAEGFSQSIARVLEADDVDDLPDAVVRDGGVTVAMRNEALETHAVRALSLLAVRPPKGASVLRGFAPGFLAAGALVAPSSCDLTDAAAGSDGCSALADGDGRELNLASDGENLATRTSVTLTYPAPHARDLALALTVRNSLMSTFVFYHMLALHGREAGAYIARMERGDPKALASMLGFSQWLGGIDVSVRQGSGAFEPAGTLGYIGPIARATRGLALHVGLPDQPVDVRLTFARAHWRFDAARLAPLVAGDLVPIEVQPEVVTSKGRARDPKTTEASLRGGGDRVVTLPGDEVIVRFPIPAGLAGEDRVDYFLHSRGYYYEWMREQWLRDEDAVKARTYFADPARAYRELAPMYKAMEPEMESIFRASRFERQGKP